MRFKYEPIRGHYVGERIMYKGKETMIVAFYEESKFILINKGYSKHAWKDDVLDRYHGLVGERYTCQAAWEKISSILDNICGTCKNVCKDKDIETCPFYEERKEVKSEDGR